MSRFWVESSRPSYGYTPTATMVPRPSLEPITFPCRVNALHIMPRARVNLQSGIYVCTPFLKSSNILPLFDLSPKVLASFVNSNLFGLTRVCGVTVSAFVQGEVMGSILGPNRVIAKDVKSCTYCCYVRCATLIV